MTNDKTICHRDGSCSFWSVMKNVRVRKAHSIMLEDFLALNERERERLERHGITVLCPR